MLIDPETYTFYLFARPSFLEGMASSLDLFGTLRAYNVSPTGEIAEPPTSAPSRLAASRDKMWAAIRRNMEREHPQERAYER